MHRPWHVCPRLTEFSGVSFTELFHAFSLDCFQGCIAHKTGGLVQLFVYSVSHGSGNFWITFPVNMPDPTRIRSGSAGKHWPEAGRMILAHWLASGPDPFGQNLTQSDRTKSDPSWFSTILSWTSVEERNRVWKWETGSRLVASCQKPGQMIPAHQLASRPDVFGQTLTRPFRSFFCLFVFSVWSMPSLGKRNWNGCGKLDPAARHNWP